MVLVIFIWIWRGLRNGGTFKSYTLFFYRSWIMEIPRC